MMIRLFFLISILCFSACSEDFSSGPGGGCDLKVTVTGFTGNPRDNIKVTIYATEEDAVNKTNQLNEAYTDASGVTEIQNLNVGQSYWVRAQALLSKRIKSTGNLRNGTNYFSMKLL